MRFCVTCGSRSQLIKVGGRHVDDEDVSRSVDSNSVRSLDAAGDVLADVGSLRADFFDDAVREAADVDAAGCVDRYAFDRAEIRVHGRLRVRGPRPRLLVNLEAVLVGDINIACSIDGDADRVGEARRHDSLGVSSTVPGFFHHRVTGVIRGDRFSQVDVSGVVDGDAIGITDIGQGELALGTGREGNLRAQSRA